MNAFWLGVVSGIPMMIAVGPVAVLLVETGIEHGFARAWSAGIGVAASDLTFAAVAAAFGAGIHRVLAPYDVPMRWTAAALLVGLAITMFRRSVREIRATSDLARIAEMPASAGDTASRVSVGPLFGRMFLLTACNPLTVAAFTSLVIATGDRGANLGWPLGIGAASVTVHLGLVGLGSSMRRRLPPLGPSWLRLAGSLLIVGLASNLVVR